MSFKSWYKRGVAAEMVTPAPGPVSPSRVTAEGVAGRYAPRTVDVVVPSSIPVSPGSSIPGGGDGRFGAVEFETGIDILSTTRAARSAMAQPDDPNWSGIWDHEANGRRGTPVGSASGNASGGSRPPMYKALPRDAEPSRGPRVRFFDPLSLVYASGFRDRRYSLTYDVIRRTTYQLSLVGAIIATRANQVAAFAQPFRENKQVGFQIRAKDETKVLSAEERQYVARLEQFVMECGWGPNPYCPFPRDRFSTFLKKATRDTLSFDQMCAEVVPDVSGRPFEFRAVDATTIRLGATYDGYRGDGARKFTSEEFSEHWRREYGEAFELDGEGVYSVQVLHGRIENIFTYHDMMFGIRNGRSDVWVNGYGFSEVEMCLNSVLRLLWAEEYNARIFRQGSMANGVLNFKGDTYDPSQMEAFRRIWTAQVAGVENAHRVPIVQIPEGVEFVKFGMGNKEMEYRAWLEYLLKIVSGTYQIDPSEINFDLVSGGSQGGAGPMFESKHEWKIKYSKDKGLRPLLKFLAEQLNTYIIDPLDSRYYLDFVGLDQMTETERIELLTKKVTTFMTINEGRKEEGLDPIPGGDIVNNPTFLQSAQAAAQDSGQKGPSSPFAPWRTAGELPDAGYGDALPVPLYLQVGDEGLDVPPSAPGGEGGGGGPSGAGGPPGPDGMPGGGMGG